MASDPYSLEMFKSPAGIAFVDAVIPLDKQIMDIVRTNEYGKAHIHSTEVSFAGAPPFLKSYLGAPYDVDRVLALAHANKLIDLINQIAELINATVDIFTPDQVTAMITNMDTVLNQTKVMLTFYA